MFLEGEISPAQQVAEHTNENVAKTTFFWQLHNNVAGSSLGAAIHQGICLVFAAQGVVSFLSNMIHLNTGWFPYPHEFLTLFRPS